MFTQFIRPLVAGFALVLAAQAGAYQITTDMGVQDVGGEDILWGQAQLPNSNPVTEETWAEGILGVDLDFSGIKTETVDYYETEMAHIIAFALVGDPGYFIVKNAQWTALFENTDSKGWGVIDINKMASGFNLDWGCSAECEYTISHVTEFGGQVTVPEPGSAILMLLGILGLWAGRRHQHS